MVRKEIKYKCLHTVNCINRLRSFFWIFQGFFTARHGKRWRAREMESKRAE
jgi:hypothetical protein